MFFEIWHGYGSFHNGAFYGHAWRHDELSNCFWNSKAECEKQLNELSKISNGEKFWINE